MKHLACSPYAIFSAKEWNSLSKNSYAMNLYKSEEFHKKCHKKLNSLKARKFFTNKDDSPQIIQLSFA